MEKSEEVFTKLPIGESNFELLIEDGSYYVDKTLFIKDILDKGAKFTLCTRPRRFGKTLTQSMLRCFFEDTAPLGGKDRRGLFNGLKIESAGGGKYMEHQGKYPVIYLSFAGVELYNFKSNCDAFKKIISAEFRRHKYVTEKISEEDDLKIFKNLCSEESDIEIYKQSLRFLCQCLENYHGRKTVILIDEYDVPLQNAWACGFYDEMIKFIRPFLKDALKDNDHLRFAVMTGCLRVSKESIFTGLNNLDVVSILNKRYDEYFGFTQSEVDAMLAFYNLEEKTQIVRDWYNGYLFGNAEVYNPWSLINAVNDWAACSDSLPKPYWSNTSSNDIVRKLLENADAGVKADIETLLSGGVISKKVHEDVTYDEVYKNSDNLWNFLFFTGYLKKVGEHSQGVQTILDLSIPNSEILYIYETHIQNWYNDKVKEKDFGSFFEALLNGNAETVQDELNRWLLDSISYMDGKEDFYHGLVLGMLGGLKEYSAKSNRETGHGRCDIVLRHLIRRDKAVLMELKWTTDNKAVRKECDAALKQIEDNQYVSELEAEGYTEIIKYGVAFCGKYCEVKIGQ